MNSVSRPDCQATGPAWLLRTWRLGKPWALPGSGSSSWSGALLSRKFIVCFGPAFQAPGDSMLAPVPSQALEDCLVTSREAPEGALASIMDLSEQPVACGGTVGAPG